MKNRRRIRRQRDFGSVVGIDMGASHLHYALADSRGKILNGATEKLRPEDGPRRIIRQIIGGIRGISGRKGVESRESGVEEERLLSNPGSRTPRPEARIPNSHSAVKLRGVAIGVPSPVDADRNAVALAANLPGWKTVRLGHELEKEFRVPVSVENDANMAAIGEHWRGVARGVDNFVFIALGTGIGSGIFIDGKLYRGRSGAAGELCTMNVEWQRWAEDFGDVGYLESRASGLGIAAEGRKHLGRPAQARGSSLARRRDAYFVFQSYRERHRAARKILERAFTILGVGIANIISILDPELIVIGGGVSKGAPDFMLATAGKVVGRIHKNPPRIKLSSLGDKAQTYGAIFSALNLSY